MRRLLYISPLFPPHTRVGALRPLKFVRHLPANGWIPTVLCDLQAKDPVNWDLVQTIPAEVEVVRDYGPRARRLERKLWPDRLAKPRGESRASQEGDRKNRHNSWDDIEAALPLWLRPGPEFNPLGPHSLKIPHAVRAAKKLMRKQSFDAILVNADPYAALVVGLMTSRDTGAPLVVDFRDPWSICEFRRPSRLPPQRVFVDWLERRVVEASARVILNTKTCYDDYRRQYSDVPEKRFSLIPNHADPDLVRDGEPLHSDVFSMVYLGRFRRFLDGEILFRSLFELRKRGIDAIMAKLYVTGEIWPASRKIITGLDVWESIVEAPYVPIQKMGPFLNSADLLICLDNATSQRVPAKLFDYAMSHRPVILISSNPETLQIGKIMGGVTPCPIDDVNAITNVLAQAIVSGRSRDVERNEIQFNTQTATRKLAVILDEVSHQKKNIRCSITR